MPQLNPGWLSTKNRTCRSGIAICDSETLSPAAVYDVRASCDGKKLAWLK